MNESPRHGSPSGTASIAPIHRSETLTEAVFKRLSSAIMEGVFVPGAKISTREIAADLGVSPTPAREALLRLVGVSVLEMPNARTIKIPKLTVGRHEEIVRIRLQLEGLAAEIAAPMLTLDDVSKLEIFQLGLSAGYAAKNTRQILSNNRAFHFHIYERCEMPLLISMIENCWLLMGPSLNLLYPHFIQGGVGPRNHQNILAAIRNQNGAALKAAVEQDILDGVKYLRPVLQSH